MTDEEKIVLNQVKEIRGFYSHLISFVLIMALLFVINYVVYPKYIWAWWAALGWGVGLVVHGLSAFEVLNFFGPEWERKQIEKRLGRKL